MATGENSTRISGRTSRSSFNCDWTGKLKLDCHMWQIAEVLPAILPYLIFWQLQVEFGEMGYFPLADDPLEAVPKPL
jgi:hypothetical protein